MTRFHRTIWAKLSLIFLGFLVLVTGSVAATFYAVQRQATDTLVISLTSHQRVLLSSISRSVIWLQINTGKSEYYLELLKLEEAAENFNRNQAAMLYGGSAAADHERTAVEIPPLSASEVQEQFTQLQTLWQPMKDSIDALSAGAEGAGQSRALTEIESNAHLALSLIDAIILMLERSAERNLTLLKSIQVLFFLGAIGLIIQGYILVKRDILQPLKSLDAAAQQIASGDLSRNISLDQHNEFGALAKTFDNMRQEVAATRKTSEDWTEILEARVEQRTEELQALLEISAEISSQLDVEQVLKSVVDTGREVLSGNVSVICLLHEENNELSVASFSGPRESVVNTRVEINPGLLSDVVDRGRTVVSHTCEDCPILAKAHLKDVIAAPLQIGENTIGAICVAEPGPEQSGEDSSRVLTLLANSAAIAIENARLYSRLQTTATLAERERIAAEMHDGLAQTLSYLNLKVDQIRSAIDGGAEDSALGHIDAMQPAIQSAYDTVRRALTGLSDTGLVQQGFTSQLQEYLIEFSEESSTKVDLSLDESCLPRIVEEAQPQLMRIAQESLTNIRRHAEATQVWVTMERQNGSVVLTIVDDGKGFNPAVISNDGQQHLGLKIMRGRVERVGGSLLIESQPGDGTRVIASVPLKDSEN